MSRFFVVFCLLAMQLACSQPSHRILAGKEPVVRSPPHITRTKACPPGFELVGKKCERTDVLDYNYICPSGSRLVDGRCVIYRKADRQCPAGYQRSGEECQTAEKGPASFQCEIGDLDESGRSCRLVTELPPTCPKGLTMTGSGCLRYSPKVKICPAGYVLQGKECVRQVAFSAKPTCPVDMSLHGKQCRKDVPIPPRCPPEYSMEGDECVKTSPKVPAPCPTGYSVVGESCHKTREVPVTPVCPSKFTLDGKTCTKEVPIAPTCPAGTSRGRSGECELPVPRISICEHGQQLIKKSCQQTFSFDPSPVCPPGLSLIHGKCKKVVSQAHSTRCSIGTFRNGQCIVASSSEPLLQCPADYRLGKGPACVKNVDFDCSKTTTRTECEMPDFVSVLQAPSKGKGLRHLKGDYKAKSAPITLVKAAPVKVALPAKTASKEPVCHQVPVTIPLTCSKTEKVKVEYVCADGGAPVGKSCPSQQVVEPEVFCQSGKFDRASGQCLTLTVITPQLVCPAGAKKEGKVCTQIETREAEQVCPEGSEPSYDSKNPGCIVRKPQLIHAPRVIRQAAELTCDVGEKKGKVCVDITVLPRDKMCPQGTSQEGDRCVVKVAVIAPRPIQVSQPAKFVCPDNRPASGKSCYAREAVAADNVCKSGEPHGEKCVHRAPLTLTPPRVSTSPAHPVCPSGYSLHGEICSVAIREPAAKVCPSGFDSHASNKAEEECVQVKSQVPICPPGTIQSKSGCTKKTFVAPRITQIKECTKGDVGC